MTVKISQSLVSKLNLGSFSLRCLIFRFVSVNDVREILSGVSNHQSTVLFYIGQLNRNESHFL